MQETDPYNRGLLLRRLGLICFLYAFSEAYFGVAAIQTVQNGWSHLRAGELLQFVFSATAWVSIFMGSVMMLFRFRAGSLIAFGGCLVSGLAAFVGLKDMDSRGAAFMALLMAARPAADFFMAALIAVWIRSKGGRQQRPAAGVSTGWKLKAMLLSGIALPWLVWAFKQSTTGAVAMPAPLIAVFLTVWYGIPFICLTLLSGQPEVLRHWPVAGGFIGVALATAMVSFMMWGERFDSFLMPISSPLRFASMGAGIMLGHLAAAFLHRR